MAEFENFRKRTETEKSQMFDMGAKTIVEKVLPVIDNFERGLAGARTGGLVALLYLCCCICCEYLVLGIDLCY